MKKQDVDDVLDQLKSCVEDYNRAVRDYDREVERHQDDLDTMYGSIHSCAGTVEEAKERLEHEITKFQELFSGVELRWDELFGDPRKIEHRRSVEVLKGLLDGSYGPEFSMEDLPESPEFPSAEDLSLSRSDVHALAGLVAEILVDVDAEKRTAALKEQQKALQQNIEKMTTRVGEVTNLIMALTAEREALQEVLREAHELLRATNKELDL